MLLTAFSLWFAVFALEFFGAFRSRRYPLICLTFCYLAISDFLAMLIAYRFGGDLYAWTYWGQHAGKYVLLAVLASYLCEKMLRAHPWFKGWMAGVLCAGAGLVVTAIFSDSPTIALKLLDAGLATDILLAGCLGLAWMDQKQTLKRPWNHIALGLVVLLAGELLTFGMVQITPLAVFLKWPFEIAQLTLWNLAVCGKLSEVRMPLGIKTPKVEKVFHA